MAKKKQYKIGIDIGATKMLAVLYDGEKVLHDYVLATPRDTIDHFIIMVNALVEPLIERANEDKANILGLGVGIAGLVSPKERKVVLAPNIEIIENVQIAKLIEEKLGLDVFLDNDTNCFLRAEVLEGVAKKYTNVYGFTIGTGIGGAWWNNEIYLGANGAAGEPGANVIDFENKIRFEESYHKLTQRNVLNMSNEAYKGDPLAIKSFEEFGSIFGVVISNIVNVLDPAVIVVGGGAVEVGDLFLPKAKKTAREFINSPESKKIKILKSKLGPNAGAIGAALLVL